MDDYENNTEDQKSDDTPKSEVDERWAKAELLLSNISPGWKVAIHRVRPSWCSGYLETIEVTDDEPVDIDYIVNQWGGEILKLRLSDDQGRYRKNATLALRSYPPKFFGRPMSPHDNMPELPVRKLAPVETPSQPVPNPQPPSPQLDLLGLIGLLQKTRREDLNLVQALFGSLQPPQSPTIQQDQRSSLDDILTFAEKWKQLQTLFGNGQNQPQSDEAGMLGSITEIVKALGQVNQKPAQQPAQQPQPRRGRVVPPQTKHPQQIPPQSNPNPNSHGQPSNIMSNNELSDTISRLTPEKFSDILLTALARMPEDTREKTIQTFFERSGLDEYRESDDDEDDDSEEIYEPDDYQPSQT